MIDYVKVRILDREILIENILKFPERFLSIGKVDFKSGAVNFPYRGKLENLNIRITPKQAFIEGSLHKYFNSKTINTPINCDLFQQCDVGDAVQFLQEDLNMEISNTEITQLEWGFNIDYKDSENLIRRKLRMANFNVPNGKATKKNIDCKKFIHDDFTIKCYHKGKEHQSPESCGFEITRIELKLHRKRELERLQICSLADISKESTYRALFTEFQKKFNKICFIDEIPTQDFTYFTNHQNRLLREGIHPTFWEDLGEGDHSRKKKQFINLINEAKLNKTKLVLDYKIQSIFDSMIQCH